MSVRIKTLLTRAAASILWLPAALFWRTAAWRARLETRISNLEAGRDE